MRNANVLVGRTQSVYVLLDQMAMLILLLMNKL